MPMLQIAQPEGIKENLEAFFTAVDITESFNLSLIFFNTSILFLIIFSRNHHKTQLSIFALLLCLCFFLETINRYLSNNWTQFASQNYFDKSGFFVCVMIGFPSLCNCVLIMLNSTRSTFSLLVTLAKEKAKAKKE